MHILVAEHVLMGIVEKTAIPRRVAHQSRVVACHPDASLPVFTETGDDIARQTCFHRECLETFAYRRNIADTTIEGACPQTTLAVADDGVDKTVGQCLLLHKPVPLAGLGIETDGAIVAAYADAVFGTFKQRMDMQADLGE